MLRRPVCAAAFLYAFLILCTASLFDPFGGFVRSDTIRLEQGKKQVCTVSGTVAGKWLKRRADETVLVILLRGVSTETGASPGKNQRILCETGFGENGQEPEIPAGAEIRLAGTLRPFPEAVNPGAFDTAAYYRTMDIGYRMSDCTVLSREGMRVVPELLYRIRRASCRCFERYLPAEAASVASAMVLGEKGLFDEELKDLYRESGILHIAAISGLHLSFFGNGLFRLLKKSGVRNACAAALSAGVMILYGEMAGFSPSASRAVIMFCLQMGAAALRRSYDGKTAAALSALILLFFHPLYLFHPGFQYSFAAVTAILFLPVRLPPVPGHRTLEKMTAVQLGLLPVSLMTSYTAAPYSWILNLAVIPLCGVILEAAVLLLILAVCCPPAAFLPAYLLSSVIRFYRLLCESVRLIPGHLLTPGHPGAFRLVLYAGLLAAGSLCAGRKAFRKYSLVFFCAGVLILFLHVSPALRIRMYDVGQGDGLCIRAGGEVFMVDGGSSSNSGLLEYDLLPALRFDGISRIGCWMVSHSDGDHVSALLSLLEETAAGKSGTLKTGRIILPASSEKEAGENGNTDRILRLAARCGIPVSFMSAGDSIRCPVRTGLLRHEELRIDCLSPRKGAAYEDVNDGSLVFLLTFGDFSMLFTGDLEEAEDSFGPPPGLSRLSVLKTAHHGSSGSSGERFIGKWRPETALISAGRNNPYGHPHREVIQRLERNDVRWYLTARDGAVTVRSDGHGYSVETFLNGSRF